MPQIYTNQEKEEEITAVYYNDTKPQRPSTLPNPSPQEIDILNDNQKGTDRKTMQEMVIPKWQKGEELPAISTPVITTVLYPPVSMKNGFTTTDEDMKKILHYYSGNYDYEPGVFKMGFARFTTVPSSNRLGAANITSAGRPSAASKFIREITNGEIQINLPPNPKEVLVAALYFHADWPKEGSDQALKGPNDQEIQGFRLELTPYDVQYKTFTYASQQFMALKVRTKRQDISAVYIFPVRRDSYGNFVYDFGGAAAYKRLLVDYDKVNEEVFGGDWQNFSTNKVVLQMPTVKVQGDVQLSGPEIERIYGVTDGGSDLFLIVSSMYEQGPKGITGAAAACLGEKGLSLESQTTITVNGPFMAAVVKKGLGDEYPLMWVSVRENDFQLLKQ